MSSVHSRKQYKKQQFTDEAFIEAIKTVNDTLNEADEVATDIIELFFEIAIAKEALPANTSREIVDTFLTSLIAIIGFNAGQPLANTALEILFNYIKNGKFLLSFLGL